MEGRHDEMNNIRVNTIPEMADRNLGLRLAPGIKIKRTDQQV